MKDILIKKSKDKIQLCKKAVLQKAGFDFGNHAPIFINSFAKSGTHLMSQIVSAIPEFEYYGLFLASYPSVTLKLKNDHYMVNKLNKVVAGEILHGHMFYSNDVSKCLQRNKIVSTFLFRDLRDVALSEFMYLTYMNPFHKMHRVFKKLKNDDERLMLSILGDKYIETPYYFPSIDQRFKNYKGWVNDEYTKIFRFEDLVGVNQKKEIDRLWAWYSEHSEKEINIEEYVKKSIKAIDPDKSHTYRKKGVKGWSNAFKARHTKAFNDIAGDLMMEIGYEV